MLEFLPFKGGGVVVVRTASGRGCGTIQAGWRGDASGVLRFDSEVDELGPTADELREILAYMDSHANPVV